MNEAVASVCAGTNISFLGVAIVHDTFAVVESSAGPPAILQHSNFVKTREPTRTVGNS